MRQIKNIAVLIATAISVGVMPAAIAQTEPADAGVPFAITFDGSYYPADLETFDYPYSAASQQREGDCTLKIFTDTAGDMAGMQVQRCSDAAFESVAQRYIRSQNFTVGNSAALTAHTLRVRWDIGEELDRAPAIQLAAR